MRFNRLFVLLLLYGCASSPQDIRDHGMKTTKTSTRTPSAATACVMRNAESLSFGIGMRAHVTMRPAQQEGGFEVIIYASDIHGTVGFASVVPAKTGSQITVWEGPNRLLGTTQIRNIAKGC